MTSGAGGIASTRRRGVRILAVATLASVVALSACSAEGGEGSGDIDVKWQSAPNYSLQATNTDTVEYNQSVLDTFTDETGFSVTPDVQSADVPPAMAKLLQQAAAGNAPDLAMVDGYLFPLFAEYAAPLDDQLEEAGIDVDSWLTPFQGPLTADGGAKGLQFTTDVRIMYYRKDLVPTPPTTWDEVLSVGKTLAAQGMSFQYAAGRGEDAVITTMWPALYAAGGTIFSDDGSLGFAEGDGYDAMLGMLEFIKETVDSGITPSAVSTYIDGEGLVPDLLAGKVGMFYGGNWQVGYLEQLAEQAGMAVDDMWGIAPLPNEAGDNFKTSLGGWTYAVFAKDPARIDAAAKLLIQGWIGDEGMTSWSNASGYLPTRATVYDSPDYAGNAFSNDFKTALDEYAVPRPANEEYPDVSTAMQIAMSSVASGQSSPKDALDKVVSQFQ